MMVSMVVVDDVDDDEVDIVVPAVVSAVVSPIVSIKAVQAAAAISGTNFTHE